MRETKLGIISGCGHIGLLHAVCLASLGYATMAYDNRSAAIRNLQRGITPFYEPGLPELLSRTMVSGLLTFTNQISRLRSADLVYICVETPPLADGRADTAQVEKAVEMLAGILDRPAVAAIKSTVPVGTARRLSCCLAEQGLAKKLVVVSNPEFLAAGSGIEDFMNPSRIIAGGDNQTAVEKVASIYAPPGTPVIITTWENAELIKYASNAYLATKLSLINEIATLSEQTGGDIRMISKGIGLDPRIGLSYLEAGAGFSGPGLEKDLRSLICQFSQASADAPLLDTVLYVNQHQRLKLVQALVEKLGCLDGKEIGVLGLAFKPGTDDIRDSLSVPMIEHLFSLGAAITVHDPMVGTSLGKNCLSEEFPDLTWAPTPYDAAEGKDGLLILTAWPEYRDLDLKKLKSCLAVPVIVDGRNLFDPEKMRALKIDYRGVGI